MINCIILLTHLITYKHQIEIKLDFSTCILRGFSVLFINIRHDIILYSVR